MPYTHANQHSPLLVSIFCSIEFDLWILVLIVFFAVELKRLIFFWWSRLIHPNSRFAQGASFTATEFTLQSSNFCHLRMYQYVLTSTGCTHIHALTGMPIYAYANTHKHAGMLFLTGFFLFYTAIIVPVPWQREEGAKFHRCVQKVLQDFLRVWVAVSILFLYQRTLRTFLLLQRLCSFAHGAPFACIWNSIKMYFLISTATRYLAEISMKIRKIC